MRQPPATLTIMVAGFTAVAQTHREATILGALALYRARVPFKAP